VRLEQEAQSSRQYAVGGRQGIRTRHQEPGTVNLPREASDIRIGGTIKFKGTIGTRSSLEIYKSPSRFSESKEHDEKRIDAGFGLVFHVLVDGLDFDFAFALFLPRHQLLLPPGFPAGSTQGSIARIGPFPSF